MDDATHSGEARHGRRKVWLGASVAAVLALGLVGTVADAQPICTPVTTPCQTCPDPPPCPPPTDPTCGGFKFSTGGGNTSFTTSTVTCTGAFAQNTVTTTSTLGPGNICVGPNKSIGCAIAPGTANINTNTDTITAAIVGVAIPTLSVWAFGLLTVLLAAFALRRLRRLGPPTPG